MKLLEKLRPALVPTALTPAPGRIDRSRLRAELLDLAATRRALATARETYERMQAVEQTMIVASQKAAADARAVNECREQWVRNGCRDADGPALKALEDKAAESTRAAQSAAANWDAVSGTLDQAREAIRSAQSHIPNCEREIEAAAWEIVLAERKSFFDRYERCAAELRLAEREAWAVLRHIRPSRYGGQASRNQFRIEGAINRSYIKPYDGAYLPDLDRDKALLDALAAPWLERHRELLEDPNS